MDLAVLVTIALFIASIMMGVIAFFLKGLMKEFKDLTHQMSSLDKEVALLRQFMDLVVNGKEGLRHGR